MRKAAVRLAIVLAGAWLVCGSPATAAGAVVLLRAEDSPSLDVDRDSWVVSRDVLQVINYLNQYGPGPANPATDRLDVDKDGWIVPRDVLILLNYLNSGQPFVTMDLLVTGPTPSQQGVGVSWVLGPAAQSVAVSGYRWRLLRANVQLAGWTRQSSLSVQISPQLLAGGPATLEIQAQHAQGYWSGTLRLLLKTNTAPVLGALLPAEGSTYIEGSAVMITAAAFDADGDPLEYRFLVDGAVRRGWSPLSSWSWATGGYPRAHRITVQARDPSGLQAEKSGELFGYRKPIAEPTP